MESSGRASDGAVTRENEGEKYAALLMRSSYQERRYHEISEKINSEIVGLLLNEHKELEEERDALVLQRAELGASEQETEKLSHDIQEKSAMIKEKEKEIKEIEKQKKEIEASLQKAQERIKKQEELEATAQEEAQRQRAEAEEAKKREKELQSALEKQAEELKEKEGKLKKAVENKNLDQEKERLLKKEIEEKTKSVEERGRQVEEKEKEIEALQSSLAEIKKKRSQEEEEVYARERGLKRKISELEEAIKTRPEGSEKIKEDLHVVTVEREISRAQVEEKERTIAILQNAIQRMEGLLTKQMELSIEKSYQNREGRDAGSILGRAGGTLPRSEEKDRRAEIEALNISEARASPKDMKKAQHDGGDTPSSDREEKEDIGQLQVRKQQEEKPAVRNSRNRTENRNGAAQARGKSDKKEESPQLRPPAISEERPTVRAGRRKQNLLRPDIVKSNASIEEEEKRAPKASKTAKNTKDKKAQGHAVDFKKEMEKSKENREKPKKRKSEEKDEEKEKEKEKKDFSTLFGKTKSKGVFSNRPEASSFFANLSFSDYEDSKDKESKE